MKTRNQIQHAFSPVSMKVITGDMAEDIKLFTQDMVHMAENIVSLVPDCEDRAIALNELLSAKWRIIQAITHSESTPKD